MSDDSAASTRTGFLSGHVRVPVVGDGPALLLGPQGPPRRGASKSSPTASSGRCPIMLASDRASSVGWKPVRAVFASKRLLLLLMFVVRGPAWAANWLIYIYATIARQSHRRGARLLHAPAGERLPRHDVPRREAAARPLPGPRDRSPSACFIPIAIAGEVTWLAFTLPITFGLYGFVRKAIPVDALSGLTGGIADDAAVCRRRDLVYFSATTAAGAVRPGPGG